MMKGKITYFVFLCLFSTLILTCGKEDETSDPNKDEIDVPAGYSLLWSDEFNTASINSSNWQYETGDGTAYGLSAGWGNNEMQIYTENSENSGIEKDGELSVLYISALSDGAGNFSSAKLTTKDLFSMRFGRIDLKAKLPKGQGIWPALWMLGDNIDDINWPGCGEIDIVEMLGHQPDKMYSTLHFTDGDQTKGEIQGSYELTGETFSDDYHIFSMDWTPENLTFSVDETQVNQVPIEEGMKEFLRSFYLILNVAVGGNWPGDPDNSTTFPQTMYLDYIRVFEKDDFTAPDAPALDIVEETIGQFIAPSLAQHALNDDFNDLGNAMVLVYGGGGEPVVATSEMAIDGDSSLVFEFPGGSWGGGYIELATPQDLSSYTKINFSLQKPAAISNAEIKLESPMTNAVVFLTDYTGTDVGQGFIEYSIPLADFTGLDLTQISIPFSMWNPQDASDEFVGGMVLIDNVSFL